MNGVRSLLPVHTRSPMWVMLKMFIFLGGHVLASQMKILPLKLGVKRTRELKNRFYNKDWFFCTLLLCKTFRSFFCTVHYFLCAFSAKMATYSLVIDNVYFVISS